MDSHLLVVGEISYLPEAAVATVIPTERLVRDIAATGRLLWAELFGCKQPDPSWLSDWESRIPTYGCNCVAKYGAWKADTDNVPNFDWTASEWLEWKMRLYNYVRLTLDRPTITLKIAREWWPAIAGYSSESSDSRNWEKKSLLAGSVPAAI